MLQEELEEMVEGFCGTLGLVVEGQESVSINEDVPFPAASVIKIPIMVEAFRQALDGIISLDFVMSYEGGTVGGSGLLEALHKRIELTIEDYLYLMICVSDNAATNVLCDLLGIESVNRTIREMGLSSTILARKMMDYQKGKENYTTPRDMALLLSLIHRKKIVDEKSCEKMRAILTKQQIMGGITFLLPEMEIASKTGELETAYHDVGIVLGKTPYIFCGFTKDVCDIGQARLLLARLSRRVYEVLG